MSRLRDMMHSKVISIGSVARATGTCKFDVSHYLDRHFKKISKSNRKNIRQHFISIGLLPAPKPKVICNCPECGKTHVASRSYRAARKESVKKYFESINNHQVENGNDIITKEFIALASMPVQSNQSQKRTQCQIVDNLISSK